MRDVDVAHVERSSSDLRCGGRFEASNAVTSAITASRTRIACQLCDWSLGLSSIQLFDCVGQEQAPQE